MDDPLANFLPGSPSPFRRFAMSVGVCFVCLWRDRNNGFDVLERKQFLNEFAEDCDLKGTSLSDFFRQQLIHTLVFGRTYIALDFPRFPQPAPNRLLQLDTHFY